MASQVLKFFVDNILQGCRPWDLASILKDYGEISGMYIARKRNKDGLKFSFVSFKGVKDRKEMESKLKGIKLGGNSLKINLSRFAKENGITETRRFSKGVSYGEDRKEEMSRPKMPVSFAKTHISYRMALGSEKASNPRVEEITVDVGVSAFLRRFHRSVLARVQATVDFISRVEVWKIWFSHADIWVGLALVYERVAWLRVHGVPLHLFCDEVLVSICSRFGAVAIPPHITEDDGDLSMVYVEVLVGEGKKIIEEVALNLQDNKYRVWVSEDLGD
ncbi:putative RNA recognition motif domain, nucleotide-binding alpha-beta plait domain superfamily [Helianthus anomalus]